MAERKQIPRYRSTRNLEGFGTRTDHINFYSDPSPCDRDDDAYDSFSETPLIANGPLAARKRKHRSRASTSSQSPTSSVSSTSDSRPQDPKAKLEKRRRRYIKHLGQQKEGAHELQVGVHRNIGRATPPPLSLTNDHDDMEISSGEEEEIGSETESGFSLETQTESVKQVLRHEDWHTTNGYWDTGNQHKNTAESVPTNIIAPKSNNLSQSTMSPSLQQDPNTKDFPIFRESSEEPPNKPDPTSHTPRKLRPLLPSDPNTYRPRPRTAKEDEAFVSKPMRPPVASSRKPTGRVRATPMTPNNPFKTDPPENTPRVSARELSFQEGTPRAFASLRRASSQSHGLGTTSPRFESHESDTAPADDLEERSLVGKTSPKDTKKECDGKSDVLDSSGARSSGAENKEEAWEAATSQDRPPRGSRNNEDAVNNREGVSSDAGVDTTKKKHAETTGKGTGRLASSPGSANDCARSQRERTPPIESVQGILGVETPRNVMNQSQEYGPSESALLFQSPDGEFRNGQDDVIRPTPANPTTQPRIGNLQTSCISRRVDFNRTIHPFTEQRPTIHRRSDLDSLRGRPKRNTPHQQDGPVDWTAEEAEERGVGGIQNEHQYFWLSNGKRFYRHQPLPPGWRVHVSRTNNVPYYTHPYFGISLFCPERLQRNSEIRSQPGGLVFDNTPSIRTSTTQARTSRLNSEIRSQRYGLVFDNTPSTRPSTTEETASRFQVLENPDGAVDAEQDASEDLNGELHDEDNSNHERIDNGGSVTDTPLGAMSVATDPYFSGYAKPEAKCSVGKADSMAEVSIPRRSSENETIPPEQARTDQALGDGTPGSSNVSKSSSLSSRSSDNLSRSSPTALSSPIQHSDSASCGTPTPIRLRSQQKSPVGALSVAREEVFSGSVSVPQRSRVKSPLVDDRYVEQAQSGFQSNDSHKYRTSSSRKSPGSSSSRSQDLSLESSTASSQSSKAGDDSLQSPIIRNNSPEGALRVACDAVFSGSFSERVSSGDDALVAEQQQQRPTKSTKKVAKASSQKQTPRLSATGGKRSKSPVLPSPEDIMVPDDAPMDNIELSHDSNGDDNVVSDLQTSQIGLAGMFSGLSPPELAARHEKLPRSTKRAAKTPRTQEKRPKDSTRDGSGRSRLERLCSGDGSRVVQQEQQPTESTKKAAKRSSKKQTHLSAREGTRSKTPVLPSPEDTMVPDGAPMENTELNNEDDQTSALELAIRQEKPIKSTKKATKKATKTIRKQGKRSRTSSEARGVSVLAASVDCSEDGSVAHVSPPLVAQPAKRRKKRMFSDRCYREPQDPLEWFWNHDLKHKH